MLASPLLPSPRFADETTYKPAKDLEAFNKLLPPPIEFVEGSSSGVLAAVEGKYIPINEGPKSAAPVVSPVESRQTAAPLPSDEKSRKLSQDSPKTLYNGPIETQWPKGAKIGTGLNNTGNTCFLNSALQCLLHTPPLLHILLKHGHAEPCRTPKATYCMICALRHVMIDSQKKNTPVTPFPVLTKLNAIAKHLRRGRQEDSHEFLRYFVDALQRSTLAAFPQKVDPKLASKTWVHMLFGGLLRSRVKCLSCGHDSDTYDQMMDLSVDIAGVQSLRDALRKFTTVDHLRGANKYKCEKCKKLVNADKQFTVHDAPLILTIHLKRFSPMGRKIGHPVVYEERVSLEPLMSDGQFGPSYSLYGVISHAGGGPNSGHYYAHVKGPTGQWYEMNDESVTRHGGAPTGLRNAYVLFYIREKGQALEAALNAPSSSVRIPNKAGLIANMKKRKAVDSGEDDSPPKQKPFIGPQLPADSQRLQQTTSKVDPQSELLKKKIAAATQKANGALQSLSQYADDSDDDGDDDVGEKVAEAGVEKDGTPHPDPPAPSSTPLPSSSADTSSAPSSNPAASSSERKSSPAPAIPPSSFYGTPPSKKDKKRKSPDYDDDDGGGASRSLSEYARTPLPKPRHSSGSRFSAASPFSRLKGSNDLDRRSSGRAEWRSPGNMVRYGRGGRKRTFMI